MEAVDGSRVRGTFRIDILIANYTTVYENGWAPANKGAADNDYWGVKDLNKCCGKLDVKIPADLVAGDYLLRAEVIALHTAQSAGGAQFYMSCCKFTIHQAMQSLT